MNLTTTASPITMTSLALVRYINEFRGPDEAQLRHDNFLAKVPKVLGEDHALKFKGKVRIGIGSGAERETVVYEFPKREACLMAMSYSYELQAKVFDRMTELENQAVPAAPAIPTTAEGLRLLASSLATGLAAAHERLEVLEPQAKGLRLAAAQRSERTRSLRVNDR